MRSIGFVSLGFPGILYKTAARQTSCFVAALLLVLSLAGPAAAQTPCVPNTANYPCAYVAGVSTTGTVSVINNNNTVIGTINVGTSPEGLAITPDNSTVYVANSSSGTVSVISTSTGTVTKTITASGHPSAIAITPNGSFAYVAEPGTSFESSSFIDVIDTSTNTITATITSTGGISNPTAIAITPNGASAYAADQCPTPGNACVDVINLSTNTVTSNIQLANTSASEFTNSIAITPDGAFVYVSATSTATSTSGDVEIYVIATSNNSLVGTPIDIGAFLPSDFGFAIAPNRILYAGFPTGTDSQRETTVYPVATSTNTLLTSITVGNDPTGLAVGLSGGIVYVTNNIDNTVSIIGTGTNTINLGTIGVGTSPQGVAAMRVAALPLINEPLVPSATPSGGSTFVLKVNGTGFASNSTVNWNGAALATTFVNQGQLTASVPAANIASFGTASITVTNPGPGGGTSNPVPFTITSPTASLTFAPLTYPKGLAVGIAPVYVVTADFNNDGKADLAVVNSTSGTVSILLGNGDGTFTVGTALTTGADPISAAVGDFNGDGKLDLAVVANDAVSCDDGSTCDEIDIFLGNGNGTFTFSSSDTITVFNGGAAPAQIIAGDFNGDGKLDLALATSINSVGSVFVYLGNGDGTFASSSSVAVSAIPTALVTGDFNGDGILDLAVAMDSSPGVTILLGNGDGTFSPASTQPVTSLVTPASITTGDFNGDGKLDLAVADSENGILTVLLGNGDGTFTLKSGQPVASQDLLFVTTADFNGDGKLDLALVGSGGLVFVDLGNGDGTFQASAGFGVGNGPLAAAFADFNADGRLDLAVANSANTDNTVSILEQSPVISPKPSSLSFGNQIIDTTSTPQSVTFTNSGSAPLLFVPTIGAGFTEKNEDCPVATGSTLLLVAGASCSFDVSFAPTSLGAFATTLSLGVSLPAPSVTSVSLTGIGTPAPVQITLQPASQTINSGQTAKLTVTATGTAPLTNQWFVGASGVTTNPISGATGTSFTTPALLATTSYWVQVTDAAGSKDSNTATITVNQPPKITIQPASQSINYGQTATLSVTATSTLPLSYQWYQGVSGNTTNPIAGATSNTFTTPALTATTSYWVQVSNGVAPPANSNTATITVIIVAPQITVQPASQTIFSGLTATLTVTATGTAPLKYQWFQGQSGDTSNPIAGATGSTFITPGLVLTTSYWVRVSNVAGSKNSNTATITIASATPTCSNLAFGPGASLLQVTFTATCSASTVATSINWGDGSALTTGSTPSVSAKHTYAAVGTYSVTLTATNSAGQAGAPAFAQVTLVAATTPPPVFAGQSSDTPLMLTAPANSTNNPVVKFECTTATVSNGTAEPASNLGISCTSEPPTLTLTDVPQSVTISIQTSGSAADLRWPASKHRAAFYASWLPFPGLIFMGLWTGLGSRGRKKFLRHLALGLLICLIVFGVSCGGGFTSPSVSSTGTGSSKQATPAGQYFVTVVDVPAQGSAPTGFVQTSLIVPLTVTGP